MASVWYVGGAYERRMTEDDWERADAPGNEAVWNEDNGWSVQESEFTADQLDVLQISPDFRTNQPDGPRDGWPVNPDGGQAGSESALAYYYYAKMAAIYDQFLAMYDPEAPVNVPDGTISFAKLTSAAQTIINNKSDVGHKHGVTDMTATGSPSATTYLRGDNTWGTPPNTTYSAITPAEAIAATATTVRGVNAAILEQILNTKITGNSTVDPGATGQALAAATTALIAKTALGLENVNNTADADKPVSTAQNTAITNRVPKLAGSSLVYIKDSGGNDGSVAWSVAASANSIPLRDANGQLTVIATPTATNHATSKTYVDTALNLKAPIASPTFTGTVSGITKAMVGLGNVDNTSDLNKPISTAVQSALDTKATLVGGLIPTNLLPTLKIAETLSAANQTEMLALPATPGDMAIRGDNGHLYVLLTAPATNAANWFDLSASAAGGVSSVNGQTGTVVLGKGDVGLGNVDNTSDVNKPVSTAQQNALNLKANLASPTFTGTVSGITKSMVGLGSVDNTADASKPVSTAQQAALDLKANLASPTFTGTVSGITKAMVGLGSVDNTSDANKPVSTATQTALNGKANTSHSHAISDVTSLQTALDGKANASHSHSIANITSLQAALDDKASLAQLTAAKLVLVNAQTGAYTLTLADLDRAIEINSATDVNLTLPPNSAEAFPVGSTVEVRQTGVGKITVVGGSGVTVNAPETPKSRKQWSVMVCEKRATDVWIVAGDFA